LQGPQDRETAPRGFTRAGSWLLARPDILVLLPLCGLFLYGIARQAIARQALTFDDTLFINIGHGVLTHGYPFETVHTPDGLPFYDHTPLFSYFLVPPAMIDSAFGLDTAVVSGRLMSAAFGLATLVLAYYACRDVRGMTAGVVAGLLIATNPYFLQLSWIMHMEAPMAFFMVLGLYLVLHHRSWQAGLAIAVAVMLKEQALAFWLVAGIYVLLVRGWREMLKVAVPSAVALLAWGIAAYLISESQFRVVLNRWLSSAGSGANLPDPRYHIRWRRWLEIVTFRTIGAPFGAAVVLAIYALVRRRPTPGIAFVPFAYAVVAIVASFLIRLKVESWLLAVIPMCAIAVGMLVDWRAIGAWLTRVDGGRQADGSLAAP
jgi:4-amino-4-deoxy-L-arabinose transferase-like glycosyltransferase